MIAVGFAVQSLADGCIQLVLGVLITMAGSLFALRGISSRLGADHRVVKMALRLPGGRVACGL
jgi:hypothetical protein